MRCRNMRFVLVGLLLGVCGFIHGTHAQQAPETAETRLFVSVEGNDAWSGRLATPNDAKNDGPFASIARARDAIRELKLKQRGLRGPVTVQIRGGVYYLSDPITFTPEDSGTKECPISYVAYPGEKPELIGGRRIGGFKPAQGQVLSVFLPEVKAGKWYFRQLFVDGKRQIRARYPNFDPSDPYRKGFMYVHRGIGGQVHGINTAGDWLEYRVTIPADGEYRLWMFYGSGPNNMSGGMSLSVDGGKPIPLTNVPATGDWQSKWSESASVRLTGGERLLRLRNDNGRAIGLDAFVLTDDPGWKPVTQDTPGTAAGKHLVRIHAVDYEEGYMDMVSRRHSAVSSGTSPTMFRYKPGTFKPAWTAASDAEIHIFPGGGCRELYEIVSIDRVDEPTQTVTVGKRKGRHAFMRGDRYFIENVFEELDTPGEWYLNRQTGHLYYWPKEGFSDKSEVIAPVANSIFRLEGNTATKNPIGHITIAGLTIRCTGYDLGSPQAHWGSGQQIRETTEDVIYHAYGIVNLGVITLRNAVECAIEDCTFRNMGGWAVVCDRGGGHTITRCEISGGAQGGIHLLNSSRNTVSDNHIHHLGRVCKHIAGVAMYGDAGYGPNDPPAERGSTTENVISHNLIHDISRYGISEKMTGGRNVIEYNRVLRTNTEAHDTGGIEASTAVRPENKDSRSGTVIRYNIVGDTVGYSSISGIDVFDARSIYLDGYASGYTIENNIVYRCGPYALGFTGGKYNTVKNNIFVDGNMQFSNYKNNSDGLVFEKNIVCCTQRGRERPAGLVMWHGIVAAWEGLSAKKNALLADRNLYFIDGGDKHLAFATDNAGTLSFADWQRRGFDTNSIAADPLFVDPDKDEYALRPDSPALKLGFKPIDTSQIGPRKPAQR